MPLGCYHERQDEKRSVGLGPEHDWSSHAADAFRYMAISYEEPSVKSVGVGFAHSRPQRDPDGTQGEAGCGTWGGAYNEALAVLLDLGLGQRNPDRR